MTRDWLAWHTHYQDPQSWQYQRLLMVQECIRLTLDSAPPGPLTIISMCAGQGADLLPVLAEHPRRPDTTALLVEADARNAGLARIGAARRHLTTTTITGDAAQTDHYTQAAPAHLLLLCGLFPHITLPDVHTVITHAPALVRHGGTVVWTQHRRDPDRVPKITAWLAAAGFAQVLLTGPDVEHAVGMHQHIGQPPPLPAGKTLFTFVGLEALAPGQ